MLTLLLPFTALSPVTNLTPNSSSLPLEETPIDPPLPISAIPLGSKLRSSHWDCALTPITHMSCLLSGFKWKPELKRTHVTRPELTSWPLVLCVLSHSFLVFLSCHTPACRLPWILCGSVCLSSEGLSWQHTLPFWSPFIFPSASAALEGTHNKRCKYHIQLNICSLISAPLGFPLNAELELFKGRNLLAPSHRHHSCLFIATPQSGAWHMARAQ